MQYKKVVEGEEDDSDVEVGPKIPEELGKDFLE